MGLALLADLSLAVLMTGNASSLVAATTALTDLEAAGRVGGAITGTFRTAATAAAGTVALAAGIGGERNGAGGGVLRAVDVCRYRLCPH